MKDIYICNLLIPKDKVLFEGNKRIWANSNFYRELDFMSCDVDKELKIIYDSYLVSHTIDDEDVKTIELDLKTSSAQSNNKCKKRIRVPHGFYDEFKIYVTKCYSPDYVREVVTGKKLHINNSSRLRLSQKFCLIAGFSMYNMAKVDNEKDYKAFRNYLLNKEIVEFIVNKTQEYYEKKYEKSILNKELRNNEVKRLLKVSDKK